MDSLSYTLTNVVNEMTRTIRKQYQGTFPAHEHFGTWGWVMTDLLDQIDQVAGILSRQIEHYGDDRLLSDSTGHNPHDRLSSACHELHRLREALEPARAAVRRFDFEVGHICVAVDPDAEAES